MGRGVPDSHLGNHLRCQTGGGVHRDVKGDKVGPPECRFIETLHGEVQGLHDGTNLPQNRGRLGQAKRLMAEFISRHQQTIVHGIHLMRVRLRVVLNPMNLRVGSGVCPQKSCPTFSGHALGNAPDYRITKA